MLPVQVVVGMPRGSAKGRNSQCLLKRSGGTYMCVSVTGMCCQDIGVLAGRALECQSGFIFRICVFPRSALIAMLYLLMAIN